MSLLHRTPESETPQTSGLPTLSETVPPSKAESILNHTVSLPKTNTIFAPHKTKFWMLGLVVFFATATYLYAKGYSSMKSDVMAVRRMGVPTTMDELLKTAPRTGPSAAPNYAQFQSLWAQTRNEQLVAANAIDNGISVMSRQSPRDGVEQLKPIVAPLMEGAKQPRWTLAAPNDHPLPASESFVDTTTIHDGVRILYLIAQGESTTGHPLDALPYLRSALSVCNQLGQNPGYEATSIEWESEVLDQYCDIANRHPSDASLSKQISEDVAGLGKLPNLRNAYVLAYWDDLRRMDATLGGPSLSRLDPVERVMHSWVRAKTTQPIADFRARIWRRAFEKMPSDTSDWRAVEEDFERAKTETWQEEDAIQGKDKMPAIGRQWADETARRDNVRQAGGHAPILLASSAPISVQLFPAATYNPGYKPKRFQVAYAVNRDTVVMYDTVDRGSVAPYSFSAPMIGIRFWHSSFGEWGSIPVKQPKP